jgi:ABC-type sugar transport system ATPase subunit
MRIKLEGVAKRFGAERALVGIDLEIHAGECVVLLGPSGCGKTTLLRLVAGLDRVDQGRIWIGDRSVNDVPPAERDVAMVFQNYALYPHFTVRQNIAFALRARRVAPAITESRVRATAARLGLDMLLDRRPAELSGGQQQRVALARAIVRNPVAYLMDEPLSNLDAQLRLQTRTELKRLHQELGATMIYVTHDQAEAMTLGARIAIMERGSIVQLGSPIELYRKPVNTFVATFLGSPPMNLLPDVRGGAGVTIGIRPEDVEVAITSVDAWEPARVVVVEPMGNETLVALECRDQQLTARIAADRDLQPGQPIWIRLPPERMLVFDRASGQRLS